MDKDGRIKHIKKVGEEIPEQQPQGVLLVASLPVLFNLFVLRWGYLTIFYHAK